MHGHFNVDGRKVNIPSFRTKVGQVISLRESSRQNDAIKSIVEANSSRPVPKWLDLNRDTLEAKIISLPERDDIDLPIEETLIVELYSK